jgi:hypothetical protein
MTCAELIKALTSNALQLALVFLVVCFLTPANGESQQQEDPFSLSSPFSCSVSVGKANLRLFFWLKG